MKLNTLLRHPRANFGRQHPYLVIPGQPAGLNPEPRNTVFALLAPSVFLGSGFLAEFILGPAKGRTRGLGPGMTERGGNSPKSGNDALRRIAFRPAVDMDVPAARLCEDAGRAQFDLGINAPHP